MSALFVRTAQYLRLTASYYNSFVVVGGILFDLRKRPLGQLLIEDPARSVQEQVLSQ
jgi:hypothetical protein